MNPFRFETIKAPTAACVIFLGGAIDQDGCDVWQPDCVTQSALQKAINAFLKGPSVPARMMCCTRCRNRHHLRPLNTGRSIGRITSEKTNARKRKLDE